jgi:hypothetical protein
MTKKFPASYKTRISITARGLFSDPDDSSPRPTNFVSKIRFNNIFYLCLYISSDIFPWGFLTKIL